MQRLTISCLLELAKTRGQGFSSSRIRIEPTLVGKIVISPDYPQLLELRDSTGNIPCICPGFYLDILCTSIRATRWYFTLVDNPEIFRLPPYYLEIIEFEVMNDSPGAPMSESAIQHSIVSHPDSDRATLCGLLLHVYPVFKLTQFTYLARFQVGEQRVYIFFTGDDFLSLHSLLCTNQAYCVTNISLKQIAGEDKSVKTYITTEDSTVMTAGSGTLTNGVTTSLHADHDTIEEIVTKLVEIEPGHFLLNESIHLFLTHFPSCLPVWGLRVGAKIRVSEAVIFSAELDGTATQFVWCCHHTRIQLVETSRRPRRFIPYLPEAFLTKLIFAKLIPSSSFHLARVIGDLRESFEFSNKQIPSLIKIFELQYLPSSSLILDIRRIIFTDKCIISPFSELSTLSVFSTSKLISNLSVQISSDRFFDDLSNFTIDFSAYPSWDRTSYNSLIEERMKGFIIGRVELCPDTGHVVVADSAVKIPIYFINGILPNQLVQLVGSLVAIRDYVLTVKTSSFPSYTHRLTQPYISTRHKNITTILPTQTIRKKCSSYIMLVMDKSNITLENSINQFVELRFQMSVKIFMNSTTASSQDPTQSVVGQITLVFPADTIKWWNLIQIGWLYHWSGFDSSEINSYHILRGCRTLFSSSWSLYPIGEMPASPMPSFENDVISLLHKMKEGQCKTCLIAGFVQRISFISRPNHFTKFVCQNNEWVVNLPQLKSVSLRQLHKFGISLLPLFYSVQLALTFPVTDAVFLPVYINLPHCKMPINLDQGVWVKLTGVKLKYVSNMLRGNIDFRGSISDICNPPSSHLIPSIYKKLKPLSPDNFNTFKSLSIRVAKSQLNQTEVLQPQTAPAPPPKGMYSNKFAVSRDQRYIDMEKIRMQRFAALLRCYKILRLPLRLENLSSLTITRTCICCKPNLVSECPRARVKLAAFLYANVSGYRVTVKVINRCVLQLTSISQSQINELGFMLEGIHQIEVDRNYFELNNSKRPAHNWLHDWFTNSSWLCSTKLDAIVTHSTTMQEHSADSIGFQLTLHHFQYV